MSSLSGYDPISMVTIYGDYIAQYTAIVTKGSIGSDMFDSAAKLPTPSLNGNQISTRFCYHSLNRGWNGLEIQLL